MLACAPTLIFHQEVLEMVDRTVTFEQVLRHPETYKGRVVEFGGQIVGSMIEREEVQMLVRELPIQSKPVYGPVDHDEKRGMFIIRYRGKVGDQDLQHGNMVLVVGTVMGAQITHVSGVPVSRLTLSAECFHVWRTQGNQIQEFPYGQNFTPLVQQTYCINRPNTILTTT